MNAANPLDNLRDIHLPGAIGYWPLAPGWWILIILSLALLFWLGWQLRRRYLKNNLLRVSLAHYTKLEHDYLQHQDPQQLIKQYSSLLRRVAMARFSRAKVASLTGASWLKFLDEKANSSLFANEIGQLLVDGPYQQSSPEPNNMDELSIAIKTWLKAVARS